MASKTQALRTAKTRIFKEIFAPAGFVKGPHVWTRHVNGQYHGIKFQTSNFTKVYYINVAFHYDFLPGGNLILRGEGPVVPNEFYLSDFMLWSRLESRMPESYPSEWQYDLEFDALLEQLRGNARDALAFFDSLAEKWRDPITFLRLVPPSLLREDERLALERAQLPVTQQISVSTSLPPFELAIGRGWDRPTNFGFAYFLAVIAMRDAQPDLAREYIAIAEAHVALKGADAIADLRKQLDNGDALQGTAMRS